MFTEPADVVAAMRRYRHFYDPKTTSLMLVGRGGDAHMDPFRSDFLVGIEERHEIVKRLAWLDPRARRLLILWYVEGAPVASIARKLKLSRVHCYRVQRAALEKMCDPAVPEESVAG